MYSSSLFYSFKFCLKKKKEKIKKKLSFIWTWSKKKLIIFILFSLSILSHHTYVVTYLIIIYNTIPSTFLFLVELPLISGQTSWAISIFFFLFCYLFVVIDRVKFNYYMNMCVIFVVWWLTDPLFYSLYSL